MCLRWLPGGYYAFVHVFEVVARGVAMHLFMCLRLSGDCYVVGVLSSC